MRAAVQFAKAKKSVENRGRNGQERMRKGAGMGYQVGESTVEISENELCISIPKGMWTKRGWSTLVTLVGSLVTSSLSWIVAPTKTKSASEAGEGSGPRWKVLRLDGLSCLLYHLLIPPSNELRKLYEAFDWSEIDAICGAVYKNQRLGAPAYAPQVLFRILVLMYVSGTAFESRTLSRLSTDLSWRWFVGLSIWHKVPDAGTLSRFRKRLGVVKFEALLVKLIEACDAAGLVGHVEAYYDMTGVEATATQVTPYQSAVILAKALSAYLDEEMGGVGQLTQEQIAGIALEVLQSDHPSLKQVSAAQIAASQAKMAAQDGQSPQVEHRWWQSIQEKLATLGQKTTALPTDAKARLRQVAEQLVPALPQAWGNPDATVGHTRTDGTLCGYRSGFLVDAKHLIISAVVFAGLTVREAPSVLTALDRHYTIFQRYPQRLALDSAYEYDDIHVAIADKRIDHVATVRSRPGPKGVYHSDAFIWDDDGQLRCPEDQLMDQVGGPYKNNKERYQSTADCATCPLLNNCLTPEQQAKQGDKARRVLQIETAPHQRAQLHRTRSRSPEGRALRHRRFAAERLFGHNNHYHNGDKAPYRSGPMDNIAQLMVAFVSNLETLATYG